MRARIIAGTLGGRFFDTPGGSATHPMSERVRGALFNMLGDLSGKMLLDPYAGSGAISLEAISRGAAQALAIEKDRKAQAVIAQNIQQLGLGNQVRLIKASCTAWSANNPDARFDLIIADPPYKQVNPRALSKLADHLNDGGLLVLSHPAQLESPALDGLKIADSRSYGDAHLTVYKAPEK